MDDRESPEEAIERLRRWIEDPPELATPQDVLSMLASLTSLTDELQRLRGLADGRLRHMHAADDELTRLQAENTELRAALERIAARPFNGIEQAVAIAVLALDGASHTGDTCPTCGESWTYRMGMVVSTDRCADDFHFLASHTGDTEGLTITWNPDATEPKIELIPE